MMKRTVSMLAGIAMIAVLPASKCDRGADVGDPQGNQISDCTTTLDMVAGTTNFMPTCSGSGHYTQGPTPLSNAFLLDRAWSIEVMPGTDPSATPLTLSRGGSVGLPGSGITIENVQWDGGPPIDATSYVRLRVPAGLSAGAYAFTLHVAEPAAGDAGIKPFSVHFTVNVLPSIDVTPDAGTQPGSPSLTVAVTGPGAVTSAPAGIDCGATCTASFPVHTSVTLTAAPTGAAIFAGWSGDCLGVDGQTTPHATVVMSADKHCTATFTACTGNPTPAFTYAPNPAPVGQPITFDASPSQLTGPGVYAWDFLDDNSSGQCNYSGHNFDICGGKTAVYTPAAGAAPPGTHNVRLLIHDSCGIGVHVGTFTVQ